MSGYPTKINYTVIDKRYGWSRSDEKAGMILHSVGRTASINSITRLLISEKSPDVHLLADRLRNTPGCFAIIAENNRWIFGVVDPIRGYPVFYIQTERDLIISNSARSLSTESGLQEPDEEALFEFCMAGFVTGRRTVIPQIRQLMAGEMLLWDKTSLKLRLLRYYRYFPDSILNKNTDDWIDDLKNKTDTIFDRLIEDADGRPIWVPLSGGLDSRLIVCQLARRKYKKLHTFSYGLSGNYEAKTAKKVADKIGVPWRFIPISRKSFRNFFRSEERKRYWEFCDQLCSLPNMQDYLPLRDMLFNKIIDSHTIVVNGQSGDFITGMHLPAILEGNEGSWELLLNSIFSKHFSQWPSKMTDILTKSFSSRIESDMREVVREPKVYENKSFLYDFWEWQERQCKYVVNGQRVYDWFKLDWRLPLWDIEYLNFWKCVPLNLKYNQRLYRDYLKRENFFDLFKDFNPTVWRWPGASISILPIAKSIEFLFGIKSKEKFYKYAQYFGHYGYYFSGIGLKRFLGKINEGKGAASLMIDIWLEENMNDYLKIIWKT